MVITKVHSEVAERLFFCKYRILGVWKEKRGWGEGRLEIAFKTDGVGFCILNHHFYCSINFDRNFDIDADSTLV